MGKGEKKAKASTVKKGQDIALATPKMGCEAVNRI